MTLFIYHRSEEKECLLFVVVLGLLEALGKVGDIPVLQLLLLELFGVRAELLHNKQTSNSEYGDIKVR